MKMEKILVIGGAGYLGSVLCRKLLMKNYKVRVLDSLLYGDSGISELLEFNNPNFEFIHGDIRNIQDIMKSVKGMDYVIHLGAIVGDPASNLNHDNTIQINFLATKMIISVCEFFKIKRFVFASTCSVYGDSDTVIIDENGDTKPLGLYAEMKLKSETAIRNSSVDFCILRMGTLYGFSPRMRFDLVVNLFVANAFKTGKIKYFGGEQYRCFCHVADAGDAYIQCLESKEVSRNIFNVSSINCKISDIANIISSKVYDVKLSSYKHESFDNRNYSTTSDKIKKVIDWEPKKTLYDFIEKFSYCKSDWDDYLNPIYNNYEYLKKDKGEG